MFARHTLRVILVVPCSMLLLAAAPAAGAPGDLDGTFSSNGLVTTGDFRPHQEAGARAVAVQADGKIVEAGVTAHYEPGVLDDPSSSHDATFAVARYDADGTLDGTFGGGGRIVTHFGAANCVTLDAVAIQADGKIVAAGSARCRDARFALARYDTDGSLDRSFSGDGRLTTRFARGCHAWSHGVALQSDGRIVAVGMATCPSNGRSRVEFALARYERDGSLDTSFASDGRVMTDLTAAHDSAADVAIQPDGKIVAAGPAGGFLHGGFGLVRYDARGHLDTAFGAGGKVTTRFTHHRGCVRAQARALALQADGRIVLAGMANCRDSFVAALARYDPDGRLDSSFGEDGMVTPPTSDPDCLDGLNDVAIQHDGGIVAAGGATCEGGFAVSRFDLAGRPDPTFGLGGTAVTPIRRPIFSCSEEAAAVALQPDGRIIAAGVSACFRAPARFALVRYLSG